MEVIHVDVRLRWLSPDPDQGERLSMIILPGGDSGEVKRGRAALGDALGSQRTWNGLARMYSINLGALADLRALAQRWPSLAAQIAWLEIDGHLTTHLKRHAQWQKRHWRAHWKQIHQQDIDEINRQWGQGPWQELGQERQSQQPPQRRQAEPRPPADVAAAFADLGLFPTLHVWLIGAVRRAFQRRYHPDSGSKSADLALSQYYNYLADVCTAWAYAQRKRRGEQGDEKDD